MNWLTIVYLILHEYIYMFYWRKCHVFCVSSGPDGSVAQYMPCVFTLPSWTHYKSLTLDHVGCGSGIVVPCDYPFWETISTNQHMIYCHFILYKLPGNVIQWIFKPFLYIQIKATYTDYIIKCLHGCGTIWWLYGILVLKS